MASRKSTVFLLHSTVILRLCFLNMPQSCFFINSTVLGVPCLAPNLSPLYNPTLPGVLLLMVFDGNSPTSLQVSAPLKEPIVTSKSLADFLFHGCLLVMSMDILVWCMMLRSSLIMLMHFDAKSKASSSGFAMMDGQNSTISNTMKFSMVFA